MAELKETMVTLAEQKRIKIILDVPSGLPFVQVDAGRIQQALSNLISNSIKFSPPQSEVILRARQEPGQEKNAMIRVSVSDSGPGIPSEEHVKIFNRFWQRKGTSQGIGLGLTIVKGIVEEHQGQVGVESQVGIGSTFWFTVPIAAAETKKSVT